MHVDTLDKDTDKSWPDDTIDEYEIYQNKSLKLLAKCYRPTDDKVRKCGAFCFIWIAYLTFVQNDKSIQPAIQIMGFLKPCRNNNANIFFNM